MISYIIPIGGRRTKWNLLITITLSINSGSAFTLHHENIGGSYIHGYSSNLILQNSKTNIFKMRRTLCQMSFTSKDDTKLEDEKNETDEDNILKLHSESKIYTEGMPDLEKDIHKINENSILSAFKEKIGQVDESRLTFKEFKTGEVPRLYSNLEYRRNNETGKITSAVHKSGSTVAAAALVAGTAIGAGILAAPAATAPAGFLPSTGALAIVWWYMLVSGLLLSELSLNRMGETGRSSAGILEIYKSSLPPGLSSVATVTYFFLHYAVMVAYFAQGGSNLSAFLDTLPNIPEILNQYPSSGQVLFATTIGSALYVGNKESLKDINNALVLCVLLIFFLILGIGGQTADFSQLIALQNQHPEQVVNAFPILFMSIVYQNIVPTVVLQLEGDRKKIRRALIGGTAIPVFMLLGWNAVILGNVLGISNVLTDEIVSGNLDPIQLLQSGDNGGPVLSALVSGFSELAIVTSLIGFVYALTEALADVTNLPKDGPNYEQWKPLLYAGVIVPPLLLSVGNPNVFFEALEYGGAFGVSTLFLVLPPIMVWKLRYGEEEKSLTTLPMVFGGKLTLGSLWKAAATLIFEQGAEKLGVFEWIHDTFLK